MIRENMELRDEAKAGFDAAAQQMIEHFDGALIKFESDVHEGKASVRVVSNNGVAGGGGALDGLSLIALLSLAAIGRVRSVEVDL